MTAGSNGHNALAEALQEDTTDWRAEAQFWQLKYFEQLMHSTQIITALSRPMLGQVAAAAARQ